MPRFAAVALALAALTTAGAARAQTAPEAVPRAECGPGSRPETGMQGRVSGGDHASGYSDLPITCNAELIAHVPATGGFKVERYVDVAGRECAYFDSTLLFPVGAHEGLGTTVLDMGDPARPAVTARLATPAMLSPHESLLVNERRGLLAAVMGNPTFYPGVVDVYDVSADCRTPQLRASAPVALTGHESGFSPDGHTFYASSIADARVTAVDVSDPSNPVKLWEGPYASHGLSISADGNRAYLAARTGAGPGGEHAGLVILDVSEIQARHPSPQVRVVGTLTWPDVSIPQNAMPITIDGHPYLLEVDEFASTRVVGGHEDGVVGAARIIDIGDEANPFVVSTIKLEVHLPQNRAAVAGDPGSINPVGYTAHYCGVPSEVDPGIAACSMILSGLRVFDIRDPLRPREVAYFNSSGSPAPGDPDSHAITMSRPAFVPERAEIWYTDGVSGFYVVRLTNGAWPGADPPPLAGEAVLPRTGPPALAAAAAAVLAVAVLLLRRARQDAA